MRVLIAVGIMLAPQLVSGVNILLSSPDHIGTSVPVMVVWLILDHARPRWYVPVIAGVFLGWATVADMLVLYIGVLPLVLVCAIRVYRAVAVEREPLASQRYDLALAAAALAGAAAAVLALRVIHAHGGFYMPAPDAQIVQGGPALVHNLGIAAEGLLLLGGAISSGSARRPVMPSLCCTWSAFSWRYGERGWRHGVSCGTAIWSLSCS